MAVPSWTGSAENTIDWTAMYLDDVMSGCPMMPWPECAIRDLYQCTQMLSHPAERVNSCAVRKERFRDEGCQPISIRRAAEQRLSVIAS